MLDASRIREKAAAASVFRRLIFYERRQPKPTFFDSLMRANIRRTKVFISYSHADRRFLDRLHVFLKPLERERFIDWWDDTRIKPGDDWRKAIKDVLDTTQVALLMLSPDFLASDFINQDELPPLVEAAAKDHAVILQVVLGPINFGTWKLNNFQTINNPARPLGKLRTRADRDEVWREVSNRIVEALQSGPTATMPVEKVAIEKTAETIALIQGQSPTSPALESEENRQPSNALLSTGSLASIDGGRVLTKESAPSTEKIPPPIPLAESKLQAATKARLQQSRLSWIQIAWWRLVEVWDEFKSCRLSMLALLAVCFLFLAPGMELLRPLGEGSATSGSYWLLQVLTFFAALILLGVCNWYTARVLFYFDFPGVRRRLPATASWDNVIDVLQTLLPRWLGIAPFLIVGVGFLLASRSYQPVTPAWIWLLGFAVFCSLLAIAFYFVLVLRRRLIGKMPTRELENFRELDQGQQFEVYTIGGVITLISLLLFVAFTFNPVGAAHNLGPGAIVLFAMSSWVTFGSILMFVSSRWQFPVFSVLILYLLLFSFWNDNHFIRLARPQEVDRADVLKSFDTWLALVQTKYPTEAKHPLYIVATEGGGIRAAYWTAIVLGEIQDENSNFASHLFAISGVAGGSLGATVFDALLTEPNPSSFKFKDKAHAVLSQDCLSPTLASMLYPDLLQRFLPWPIPFFDRGRSFELGWERAWRDAMGNDRFAGSFVDLWKRGTPEWVPALFLNGTSVEKGNRIITSNLRLTNSSFDAEDAAEKLSPSASGATKAGCHVPVSTAVQMSSRDGLLIPAGRFPDGSHILGGHYFENSGATAAWEIAKRIKDWCAFKAIVNVDVKVILISNYARKPRIGRSEKMTLGGNFMGEVTAPLYTLLNATNARGTYAERLLAYDQRRFKVGMTAPAPTSKDMIYFGLRETQVPLPTSWILSAAASRTMQAQLDLDDDVVQNKTAMNEVLEALPPAPP